MPIRIITARLHSDASPDVMHDRVVEALARRGIVGIGRPNVPASQAVVAYVNEGRWVADCPDCRGAELVTPGDPFMCMSCGNVAVANKYRAVTFPSEVAQIEAALSDRKFDTDRHWLPGETAADLRSENRARPDRII